MAETRKLMVYRVEHKITGKGPYRTPFSEEDVPKWAEMCQAHQCGGHSSPLLDGIETFNTADFCGFVSRKQLDKWFHGWKRWLTLWGYHIAVYEVPFDRVKFGRTQVAFEIDCCSRVDTLPLLR